MKIIFTILPLIVSLLAFILKIKYIKPEDKSHSLYAEKILNTEFFINASKVFIIGIVLSIGNLYTTIYFTPLAIDVIMLSYYSYFYLTKNYNYKERKAFMGILAAVLIMFLILNEIFRTITHTFDPNDLTLLKCAIKCTGYFFCGSFVSFDYKISGFKNKMRKVIDNIVESYKSYSYRKSDYFALSFLFLFAMNGWNGYAFPFPMFGLQDIMLKKNYTTGIIFMVLGGIIILIEQVFLKPLNIFTTIYSIVGSLYTFYQILKKKIII